MKNKTILIGAIAVILIVILILGFYFFKGNNKADEKQELSGDSANLASKSAFVLNQTISSKSPDYAYYVIESLNKTKCSEIENEVQKSICINGIDLIEKAIAANDTGVCFDKSINVNVRTRGVCLNKINKLKKA